MSIVRIDHDRRTRHEHVLDSCQADTTSGANTTVRESCSFAQGPSALPRRSQNAPIPRDSRGLGNEGQRPVVLIIDDEPEITTSVAKMLHRAHELGLHRVQLQHSTHNLASGAVALHAGYVSEGIRCAAPSLKTRPCTG